MCCDVLTLLHLLSLLYLLNISSEYLQANSHDSLRVLALHEMGNLQFYNGNLRFEICFTPYICMRVDIKPYCNTFFPACVLHPEQHSHTGAML